MAHFAELDSNNVVLRVVVIDNEHEDDGAAYCHALLGGRWIQTSYNARIRKQFARPGLVYSEARDMFVAPQPKPWYELEADGEWRSPLGVNPQTGAILTADDWAWLDKVFALQIDWGMNIG